MERINRVKREESTPTQSLLLLHQSSTEQGAPSCYCLFWPGRLAACASCRSLECRVETAPSSAGSMWTSCGATLPRLDFYSNVFMHACHRPSSCGLLVSRSVRTTVSFEPGTRKLHAALLPSVGNECPAVCSEKIRLLVLEREAGPAEAEAGSRPEDREAGLEHTARGTARQCAG